MATFAELLINSRLPEEHKFKGPIDKKALYGKLTTIAQEQPDLYPNIVQHMKTTGDFFATNEGISVGLEDIEPEYSKRDAIVKSAQKDLLKIKDTDSRKRRLLQAQEEGISLAKKHPGDLAKMTLSGGRGSFGQFIKTVVAPITVKGADNAPTDFLMSKSYSEGVTPGEFWMGASEARREAMLGNLATALPGDSAKQLSRTLDRVHITEEDCGTSNGIMMQLDDPHIIGRYSTLGRIDKLIDEAFVRRLVRRKQKKTKVRSPLTCESQPNVCQKCYGMTSANKPMELGTNLGLRAAQAMSEPLTQMILSSKHGGNMAKIDDDLDSGMAGFRQLVDVPKIFKNEATLAQNKGEISQIEKLPHGGFNVYVDGKSHFVSPKRKLYITKGQEVVKGEQLSSGVPNPMEVTSLRGLGAGRKYLLDQLYDVYSGSGVDMDKRNLELLVREDLNHVRVTKSDPDGVFIKNDIVPYNRVRRMLKSDSRKELFGRHILGKTLGEDFLHFTAGTLITPDVYSEMRMARPQSIMIADEGPAYEAVMYPLERVPTLSTDFISRLAHRRIKDTLVEGAAKGFESDTQGTVSPITRYIYG